MSQKIYREAALKEKRQPKSHLGNVIIYTPIVFKRYLIIVVVAVITLWVFVLCCNYTKSATVSGELYANKGVIPIYLNKEGVVTSISVDESSRVNQNDSLVEVSYEKYDLDHNSSTATAIDLIANRYKSKQLELEAQQNMLSVNISTLRSRQRAYKSERDIIRQQLITLDERKKLSMEMMRRYDGANKIEAVSADELTEKRMTVNSVTLTHQEKQQQLMTIERTLLDIAGELLSLESNQHELQAQIQGTATEFEQQSLQTRAELGTSIKAPVKGRVVGINAYVGERFDTSTPLLFLIPNDSQIEARLYLPSRTIGFIETGQKVYLRYAAYPYQQFGQAVGIVSSISEISFSPNESNFRDRVSFDEPMYLVSVKLDKSYVGYKGRRYHLKPGMKLEGEIVLESKRVYEWLLDPVLSTLGKLR